jgi:hypothetical protein
MNLCTFGAELPDAGEGRCCIGAAAGGRCTCWRVEYAEEQQPLQAGPPAIRPTMCSDCAFRHDSPERAGDEAFANSGEGALEEIALGLHGPFYCHDGMRRRVALVHPSGVRVPLPPGDYEPVQTPGRPFKASGAPAVLCAGYAHASGLREQR